MKEIRKTTSTKYMVECELSEHLSHELMIEKANSEWYRLNNLKIVSHLGTYEPCNLYSKDSLLALRELIDRILNEEKNK
jgi:hypothetical protein